MRRARIARRARIRCRTRSRHHDVGMPRSFDRQRVVRRARDVIGRNAHLIRTRRRHVLRGPEDIFRTIAQSVVHVERSEIRRGARALVAEVNMFQ